MRHGAAEDVSSSGRDADRELTPAGMAAVRRVALALRAAGGPPLGRIIASPYARAQQTAEIIQSVLGPHLPIETHEDLTPDGSAYDLAVRLWSAPTSVFLVGHQPNIEMVARSLAAPAPHAASSAQLPEGFLARMPAGFRTATVVAFHTGRPPPYPLAFSVEPGALPSP
ncbi:MAG: histidine phosphatase family protein [Polyangiaceae bacterium]